jgi:hypothetical protein
MHDAGGLRPTPPQALAAGWNVLGYLNSNDHVGTRDDAPVCFGFVARSKSEPDRVVIAVRGTAGFREWIMDADCKMVPFGPEEAGQVEQGFHTLFQRMWLQPAAGPDVVSPDTLVPDLLALLAPSDRITVLGHSLGTALATFVAAALVAAKGAVSAGQFAVYLLAPPKPGDRTFAAWYGGLGLDDGTLRVANKADAVPDLPLGFHDVDANSERYALDLKIKPGPLCAHSLFTYQYLLSGDESFLQDNGCLLELVAELEGELGKILN